MNDMQTDSVEMDEEAHLDAEVIFGISMSIINSPEGMNKLIEAAGNSPDPAKGVAQYLIMLFGAVGSMLEQTGITFDFGVITARDGVLDALAEEVIPILTEAGMEPGPEFEKSLVAFFLEMGKAAAMSETEGAATPSATIGDVAAGAGGLLDEVSLTSPAPAYAAEEGLL